MRNKKTSLFAVLILGISLFILFGAREVKADRYSNDATGYLLIIEDDAELLSETERELLVDDMKEISNYGNVAFKSINKNRSTAKSYSEEYYYQEFGNDSGMVFLIDMDNRELILSCNGEIYKAVTVAKSNTIMDNVYRYASNGDYYGCAQETFSQALRVLKGQAIAQPMKHISNAILSLIIAMLIFFVVITASTRSKRAGFTEMVGGAKKAELKGSKPTPVFINESRKYSPVQRSSGGGGGGFSGGGGGGGFSGGSGGHRF